MYHHIHWKLNSGIDSDQLYRMSRDFVSILQDLIPEVIPSQKYHMKTHPILNGYGAMDRNYRWSERHTTTDVLPAWRGIPHFSRHVTEYLNQQFPNRWIGRGCPQNWPPRSPDLTPLVTWKTWCIIINGSLFCININLYLLLTSRYGLAHLEENRCH
jgi:hypothetical protein